MRLVADLADAGNVRGAIAILGDRVIESKNRIAAAAGAWLALPADERYKTTLPPSSRDGRPAANPIIHHGLKAPRPLQVARSRERPGGQERVSTCMCR